MARESFARRRLGKTLFSHTYDRQPRTIAVDNPATYNVDEAHDLWGAEIASHETATRALAQPCSYTDEPRLVRTDAGTLIVNVPTLLVPADDPLAVGDWVYNVQTTDAAPVLLLDGPAEVEEVPPVAPSGGVILKAATLRRVTAGV